MRRAAVLSVLALSLVGLGAVLGAALERARVRAAAPPPRLPPALEGLDRIDRAVERRVVYLVDDLRRAPDSLAVCACSSGSVGVAALPPARDGG